MAEKPPYKKLRFRFEKTGKARYLSHLDLMRTFQRAFIRAGIEVAHTEGFNPHPYISIVLPLQLGCESLCEYLDAELSLEDGAADPAARLDSVLPEGLRILSAAEPLMKPGEVGFAKYGLRLDYSQREGMDMQDAALRLRAFLDSGPIIVSKKTKRGRTELDIAPHVSRPEIEYAEAELRLTALFSALEPTVNPSELVAALSACGDLRPDFAAFTRLEIYNKNMIKFK